MNRPAPIITGTVAALVLLFGLYMCSYYALLKDQIFDTRYGLVPVFHVATETSETIFWPAYRLDRLIRPNYWG